MITDGIKWHYLVVKSLPALFSTDDENKNTLK